MQTYYVGMDVHQASISVAVFDHGGKLDIESVFATSPFPGEQCVGDLYDRL